MTPLLICARCKRGTHILAYSLCGPCLDREATIEQWARCDECSVQHWPPRDSGLCSECDIVRTDAPTYARLNAERMAILQAAS